MTARLAPSFLVVYLLTINHQNITALNYIDIYQTNITREPHVYPVLRCESPSILNLSKFQCILPDNFSIIEQSCVTQPFTCYDQNFIGVNCDIPNNACDMAELCFNGGTCHSNNSLPEKFRCECPVGYSGMNCSIDNRICQNNTCWHEGDCIVMNASIAYANDSSFDCLCKLGYDGTHCEILNDMCANITCQNKAVCDYSHLAWSCKCLNYDLYWGDYCEHKSTRLVIREVLSKSFAFIAILAMVVVFVFVITMDVLTYVFGIDPVDRERQLLKSDREKKRLEEIYRRKQRKKVALKFYYIA